MCKTLRHTTYIIVQILLINIKYYTMYLYFIIVSDSINYCLINNLNINSVNISR